MSLDAIQRQLLWDRLLAIIEEQAQAIMRTAFCTIVRESGDLSAGIFDTQGRMIAQAQTGTPGFIHTLAGVVAHVIARHPLADASPGDSWITNDPWLNCGHLHDFSVIRPVFLGTRPVALIACAAHVVDVGGRGLGPDARQIYEEGLRIPPLRWTYHETVDPALLELIRINVREAGQVEGDLLSLTAANRAAEARLLRTLDEYGLDSLDEIAAHIIETSRNAMRDSIARLPDAQHSYRMRIDGYDSPLDLCARMQARSGGIDVDFTGTSPATSFGINVPMNYSTSYAWFGIKCILAPDVPTNAGSLEPVRFTAPAGCVLNALHPAPVSARHIVGHMLPDLMIGCLDSFLPAGCQAESGAALWGPQFRSAPAQPGEDPGPSFETITVHSGGSGGRPGKDGLSATAFPTNLRTVPVEVIEANSPLVIWKRELRPDSAGAGQFRGGYGQSLEIGHRHDAPFLVSAMFDRVDNPAKGRRGGSDGTPGRVSLDSGEALRSKGVQLVPRGRRLRLDLPGGAGLGNPRERVPAVVRAEVSAGLLSPGEAQAHYHLDPDEIAAPDPAKPAHRT